MSTGARAVSHRPATRSQALEEPDEGGLDGPTDITQGDDVTPVETRRERLRRETIEEIKAAAREQLRLESTSQLSLRAVARDVGLTPSAIYRYFESQQELLAAVANDAYLSAAAAMGAVVDRTEGLSVADRMRALGHGYRDWAQGHKAEFNLVFGNDQQHFLEGPDAVGATTFDAFFAAPVAIYAAGKAAGEIDADASLLLQPSKLKPEVLRLTERPELGLTEKDLNLLVSAWGAFHGFVSLELFGHLERFYVDPYGAFDVQLSVIIRAMGVRDGVDA